MVVEALESEAQDYNALYESLVHLDLEEEIEEADGNLSDNEDIVPIPVNSVENNVEKAIIRGHMVAERGSNTPEEGPSELVNLCRSLNLSLSQVNHDQFLKCFSAAAADNCPASYEEMLKSEEKDLWMDATKNEMKSLNEAETWKLEKIKNLKTKPVGSKWVFTKKFDKFGKVKKYKARLVAKGYLQKYGIDYLETYAPVVKFKSVRTLIALAAGLGLDAYQDDVPSAFLKGVLKERVVMKQPEGFNNNEDNTYCVLKKTLYGLKQSPIEWNEVVDLFLKEQGFSQSKAYPCIYYRNGNNQIFIGVYVDDIITIGKGSEVRHWRQILQDQFGIQEGGLLEWYLGMAIHKSEDYKYSIDHTVYIRQKLEEFDEWIPRGGLSSPFPTDYQRILSEGETNSRECNSNFPYRKIIGSLMYAMLGSRPDLTASISILILFLEKPKDCHVELLQHVCQYVRANSNLGIVYGNNKKLELEGYVDASYGGDLQYKSRSGYGFILAGGLISWYSGKQSITAQSSAEAEYYAAGSAFGSNSCFLI